MFNISIPIPPAQIAFDMLATQVRHLDWFKNNNRPYRVEYYQGLNDPLINKMIEDRNMEKKAFFDKYLKQFEAELYKKDLYADKISQIEQAVLKLQPCYERFENLKKSWGFEILPKYHIDINLYGIGGSYYRDKQDCGHVIIGTDRQPSSNWLARTIGHEMIHLGIEDLIINPEHQENPPIRQEEKERIVDNLCIYTMKGILPLGRIWENGEKSNYQEVASCADYMDKVVGNQPQTNLVSAVQNFLKKESR